MKKPLRTLPEQPCRLRIGRRTAIRQVGGWTVFLGALTVGACGRTPLGDPLGDIIPGDDDDDDIATTVTPTVTVTPTPEPCDCDPPTGAVQTINASALPVNSFALNAGQNVFLCHDAAGFYAMSDRCVHNENMSENGSSYNTNNLGNGFTCAHQGSRFNGNGEATGGPAFVAGFTLTHYLVTIDGSGQLYLDLTKIVDKDCRCTP